MSKGCAKILVMFVLLMAIIATLGFLTALYRADDPNNVQTSEQYDYSLCLKTVTEAGVNVEDAAEGCQP